MSALPAVATRRRTPSKLDAYQRALDNLDTQPGYVIAHPREPRCHEACAPDCNECVRLAAEAHRSEAVGADFEPASRFDRDTRPLALLLVSVVVVVLLVLLGIHLAARFAS